MYKYNKKKRTKNFLHFDRFIITMAIIAATTMQVMIAILVWNLGVVLFLILNIISLIITTSLIELIRSLLNEKDN